MRKRSVLPWPLLGVLAVLAAACSARQAEAVEPARQFLDGLRARGYYDVALDYLDRMQTSPLAPVELKETLLFEKGVILIEASRDQRDMGIREKQLDDAQEMLKQFVGQRPDHAKANAARSQLGNLIVERARLRVEQSKKGNKAAMLQEARKLYEEAYQVFQDRQKDVHTQLERIPKVLDAKDKQQADLIERRTQLRADYLQTQLLAAAIREEMADTAEKGSKDAADLLAEAASQFDEIYKKYRTRLAGLYARMYQARCNQKLGKLRDALGYYGELLDQPDSPDEFRELKTKTLRLAMDCWLDPSEKKYVEAIKRCSDWVAKARPNEDRESDWLYLRLSLAKAYLMQADETKSKNPKDTRTITQSRSEARKMAQFVARHTSEFQKEAQELVAKLGGPDRTGEKPQPRNFVQARDAGKDALDAIRTASLVIQQVPARIAQEKDPQVKADLEKQLEEARQTQVTSQQDATEYFRLALKLADEGTALEDVNIVRYFLCYLYYLNEDYYAAGLMGDFVARRYPDSAGARQCAKIAMAGYLKLYGESKAEDKEFETDHIVSVAEYITEKWPDQPEAQEALNTLVPFMINAGELERAQQFLAKIPEGSAQRGEAESITGQALWRAYLQGMQELRTWEEEGPPEGVDATAQKAKLEEFKSKSQTVLAAGFDRALAAGSVDKTVAIAGLSLAQVYVDTQQAEKAVEVLEQAQIGPLTLVNNNHPATQGEGFAEETYKTALRAYISSLATSSDSDKTISKANEIMDKMQAAAGETEEGKKRLVAVYVGLAHDLESQMALASPEAKTALSKGFETFLEQLKRSATELNVLNWVAETFASLGSGFDSGEKLTTEANRYYEQAASTFSNILDTVRLDPQMKTQIRMRVAVVRRKQREYKKALDTFEAILRENQMMLNVQVEAARTYQQWAGMPGKEVLYERAIMGHRPDEKTKRNIVWGWGRIAQTTARYTQFRDTFHEARYNLALCRYKYALSQQGSDQEKTLEAAERDITMTKRLFPDLGGEKWTGKYDALLRKIQQAQGKRPVGLQAVESAAEAGR